MARATTAVAPERAPERVQVPLGSSAGGTGAQWSSRFPTFTKHTIANGVAVSGIDVKDINGDGALDIVAIGGSPTNNVVWYENSK